MSDETNDPKNNLRLIEFGKKGNAESKGNSNKVIAEMFLSLSERALGGDIEDFVITFKSRSKGIESMMGAEGGVSKFDFVGYIGMLEVLKTRLMTIMSQWMYSYAYEPKKPEPTKPEDPKPEDT